jgi:DNA polymerase elongation subunit (family B)
MRDSTAVRTYFEAHPIVIAPAKTNPPEPLESFEESAESSLDCSNSPEAPGSIGSESSDPIAPEAPDPVDVRAEELVRLALDAAGESGPLEAAGGRETIPSSGDDLNITNLYGNAILFGHDGFERLVAVEFAEPNIVTLYRREPSGETVTDTARFTPFLWEESAADRSKLLPRRFSSWAAMRKARIRTLNQKVIWNPVEQYLLSSGRTLFKGMQYGELRRLQIDIETSCTEGFEGSAPSRDPIIAIALSDSTGWETLLLGEEADMLRSLSALIIERDPDVIEGHNFFGFDLPFIMARARKLSVPLLWGRDGSHLYYELDPKGLPRLRNLKISDLSLDVRTFRVRGRHLVDTMVLAALYDSSARRLPNLKLKAVAATLGVQDKDRVILQGSDIQRAFFSSPESFKAYALGDVRETRGVSDLLSPSYFIQSQMFPLTYQEVFFAGNATRLNSLLLREYFRAGQPTPVPHSVRKYRGALCELHQQGVIRDVCHCDVSSLYPTIMLLFGCLPSSDTLGVLCSALTDLRNYRLRAKRLAENATLERSRIEYAVLQNAFKILINSAYGYLGTPGMNFGNIEAAEMVTAIGRNLIGRIRDCLAARACFPIELDTDGIYFHLPPMVPVETLSREIGALLPRGMELGFDRTYAAMLSYKKKNHALLSYDGRVTLKGGALKSRGTEPFLSRYKAAVLLMLLTGKEADIPSLFELTVCALRNRELPLEDLAKSQTLKSTVPEYLDKVMRGNNKDAAYEAVIAAGRTIVRGDKIAFYLCNGEKGPAYRRSKLVPSTGQDSRDEDVESLVRKLEHTAKMFDRFAPHLKT